jgi:hypothetical protein
VNSTPAETNGLLARADLPGHPEHEADARQADALLFDLATALRSVPVGPHTRQLHLRALTLKRDVNTWIVQPPPRQARRKALDELGELSREAAAWLRHGDGTT